jgi:hypothetical protein
MVSIMSSTIAIDDTIKILSGMMTAYALARIFSKLFGEVDFAAIDTDRNKYPIGENHSSSKRTIDFIRYTCI